jgi:protein-L-isoaspartate(D-aspartate) O-methyltransferase
MQSVLRHRFVPADMISAAYEDRPLPIGHDQTISQPYIVALMTESVRPQPGEKALDVGTGSGYQAAVLAELVDQVYGIEIVEPLAKQAADRMTEMGYKNVTIRAGDGYRGWKEHAPFDIIIVAAAPEHIPQPLIEQLATGGRMIIPVGAGFQELILLEKLSDGSVRQSRIAAVRFVPMTGEAAGR